MTSHRDRSRVVIAGASSLLGAELRALLESGPLAAADFRLVDEESAAGTLTDAGGEASVIQGAEEDSFTGARLAFFTGSAAFTARHVDAALRAGARVIDLSGGILHRNEARAVLPACHAEASAASPDAPLWIPSAAGIIIAAMGLSLREHGLKHMSAIALLPVSEAGRSGIEELETQTSQLLSFQSVGTPVFDAQVAFNLLDHFGPASTVSLAAARARVRDEVRACLAPHGIAAAVQVAHAPVFYGTTVAICAMTDPGTTAEQIAKGCGAAGFQLTSDDSGPSNTSVAGESLLQMARPESDPSAPGTWWFWCAADNVRLPAARAAQLAEKLS